MHLQTKRIHGHEYLYAVHNARVGGRSRKVEQIYLGKLEDLVAERRAHLEPKSVQTWRFGAPAALWALSEELGLRAEIDRRCDGASGPGASIGTYLILAAINRAIEARSKRGFAKWYRKSCLERLSGIAPEALSSQAFWTAMDRFPMEAGQQVLSAILPRLLQEAGESPLVAFDCTNFFSFIASSNGRPTLPRRGHNKAKRHDLRQVGLALAATAPSQLPLFYELYAGNQADVTTFSEVWPRLLRVLDGLGLKEGTTIVYDKGNLSRDNQQMVDASEVSYVTSFAPHLFPDLLAVPLSGFTAAQGEDLAGFSWYREERVLWGRQRTMLQSYSPTLAAGQEAGVRQHLAKAERLLQELQQNLERRQQPGARGRKPTRQGIEKKVQEALKAQHLRRLVKVSISQDEDRFQLDYEIVDGAFEHLEDHLFGRRIWVTDHEHWSAEEILRAAHQQNDVEACFRDLHGDEPVAWSPAYHWTDQKLAVHAFYMVLGLLLVRLLRLRARRTGDDRGTKALIEDLQEVDECLLVYPAAGPRGQGRPRLVRKLSDCSPQQQRLLQVTGALAFGP